MGKIFKIEDTASGRIIVHIFGVKICLKKKETYKERKRLADYYKKFKNPMDIPKAEGYLRLIQKANLRFLKEFDKVCVENGINYWLDFGTLLGAIRHKGYIPWDDDIDVGMLREDYEKIIKLFEEGKINNKDMKLEYSNNYKNKCFAKIKRSDAEYLFVDIFPYDFYYKKLSSDEKKVLSDKIKLIVDDKTRKENSIASIRERFLKDTKEKILAGNIVDKSSKPALFMAIDYPHRWQNKVYDYESIFPLKKIEFEGEYLFAPNSPEDVLQGIYGNYMQMPKDCYPRHSSYANMTVEEKQILESIVGEE